MTIEQDAILLSRAARLATTSQGTERRLAYNIAIVAVGSERFGLPATSLREILLPPAVAKLPDMPAWLLGITQIRGEIISVVDLARWLGVDTQAGFGCFAVVEGARGPLALAVSEHHGFRSVFADELARETDYDCSIRDRPILAITDDLVAILDVERVVNEPSLVLSRSS